MYDGIQAWNGHLKLFPDEIVLHVYIKQRRCVCTSILVSGIIVKLINPDELFGDVYLVPVGMAYVYIYEVLAQDLESLQWPELRGLTSRISSQFHLHKKVRVAHDIDKTLNE